MFKRSYKNNKAHLPPQLWLLVQSQALLSWCCFYVALSLGLVLSKGHIDYACRLSIVIVVIASGIHTFHHHRCDMQWLKNWFASKLWEKFQKKKSLAKIVDGLLFSQKFCLFLSFKYSNLVILKVTKCPFINSPSTQHACVAASPYVCSFQHSKQRL